MGVAERGRQGQEGRNEKGSLSSGKIKFHRRNREGKKTEKRRRMDILFP